MNFMKVATLLYPKMEEFNRYSLDHYYVHHIFQALSYFELETAFVSIPVFDALIGNQDRHCDNWGIIRAKGQYVLAPIYDNGASLGFNLKQERLTKMLKDDRMFQAFTNRSYSLIGIQNKQKPKHIELLFELKKNYSREIQDVISRFTILNKTNIQNILDDIPDSIMNEVYKEWVLKLLLYRRDWLINRLGGRENQ